MVFVLQQQNQLRERVFTLSHKLSAMSFGQDRYRRRYWVLPKCGGIFVEGLESSEPESADANAPETDTKVREAVAEERCFKPVIPPNAEQDEKSWTPMETDSDCNSENKVKPEDLNPEHLADGRPQGGYQHVSELTVCENADIKTDHDKAESSAIKQENETANSNRCSTLKAELISLNCLIGDDMKVNGELSMVDCKNGFVDLKNCIRSDGDCIKVEPLPVPSLLASVSDTKQGNSADDGCTDVKQQTSTVDVAANPSELVTNDLIQSSLSCKPDDDQLSRTSSKDEISVLQHSAMLQLAVANAVLAQSSITDSQSYGIASSQHTSQVATPSSELSTGLQLDLSAAGTPVSFMQPSRTSTPAYLSTSFLDDMQLSADGELQPDYLAIPQNVQLISLGNSLFCIFSEICCLVKRKPKHTVRERNLNTNVSIEHHADIAFYARHILVHQSLSPL